MHAHWYRGGDPDVARNSDFSTPGASTSIVFNGPVTASDPFVASMGSKNLEEWPLLWSRIFMRLRYVNPISSLNCSAAQLPPSIFVCFDYTSHVFSVLSASHPSFLFFLDLSSCQSASKSRSASQSTVYLLCNANPRWRLLLTSSPFLFLPRCAYV